MKKVLVVDDSLSVARQLEKIIGESGDFTCVGHAKNGAEAIKMNHSEDPEIICMDMNMPGMDGLTALRTLTVMDKEVKVVMVTSLAHSSHAATLDEAKARLTASRAVSSRSGGRRPSPRRSAAATISSSLRRKLSLAGCLTNSRLVMFNP